jgi:hypothetical protein
MCILDHVGDQVVQLVINQSALLFRNGPTQRRRKTIHDRIEQVRGMVELVRRVEYPDLAARFEQHIEALEQTLKQD